MLIYATRADVEAWGSGSAVIPADVAQYLRKASILVRNATRRAMYSTDAAGKPADEVVRDAFRDATVCHAVHMITSGVDPAAGLDSQLSAQSKSFGPASVTYVNAAEVAMNKQSLLSQLYSEAYLILDNEGLINGQPRLF